MEHILLPTTIEFLDTDRPNVGQVVITPCHQGYGTTLGNALRRVLLSSLPGAAVESVKIVGAQHEFSSLSGVREDIIEIILNLKQLAVRSFVDVPVRLSLSKKGSGQVTGADFEKNSDVEIMNPELVLATLTDDKIKFDMEIVVGKGRGYVPVSEKETKGLDLGTIAIDSLYTPIRDVGYNVELTRVGDVTDYEKLTLLIETNGTITPKDAVSQSTKILMDHFALIMDQVAVGSGTEIAAELVVAEATADEEESGDESVAEDATEDGKPGKKSKAKKKK
ncbi:MAG: DNA-directed RNA polymerase subunit alpha [Candidatus Magasanikbacteria bacterium]|nr:DNA-directed RNA polymerase subunit alpha [Candidatus Magasanikbacteria bacterium]